jgi:hypothetical protein
LEFNLLTIFVLLNSIFHKLLIAYAMGCSLLHSSTAALVSSYLFLRHQRVGCGDNFSSLTQLVAGVLQASLISPLYFSLFMG